MIVDEHNTNQASANVLKNNDELRLNNNLDKNKVGRNNEAGHTTNTLDSND